MTRRILLTLLTLSLIVSWAALAVAPATAQTDEPGDAPFALCEGTEDASLSVVLLLDRSGSMEKVAPEKDRFAAVNRFVGMLLRTAEDTGRSVQMNTVLFDTGTDDLGWQPIATQTDVDRITAAVEAAWSNKNLGNDTDQVVAFGTAFDLLEQQDGCRVVVMLTDGVIDTQDPGQNPEDIARARTEACTATASTGSGPSLRERAKELGTNEFILLLEPTQRGIADFGERLAATMTLFTSITGDRTPPSVPYPRDDRIAFDPQAAIDAGAPGETWGLMCEPLYDQTGLVLSAADASQLEAYFLKLGAELGSGEAAVDNCPQPIPDGTEPLPDGTLIRRIQVINFDGGDGMSLDDFQIRRPDGTVTPAGDGLRALETSAIEVQLEIADPAALPAGWRLQPVAGAEGASGYCVEVTAREGLTAGMTAEENPIPVAEDDTPVTLSVGFAPDIAGYELSFELNGVPYTTTGTEAVVKLDPDMAKSPVVIGSGSIRALETDLFADLPINITSSLKVWDRSPGALPTVVCDRDAVTLASGEVPASGTVEAPTGCTAIPGATTVTGSSDATVEQHSFVRIVPADGASADITFTDADGNVIDGDWQPLTEPVEITARISDLPNDTVGFTAGYAVEVASGPETEMNPGATPDGRAEVALSVDLLARSNGILAGIITVLIALLAAFLSMLLLWLFNRMTAQLPKATDFFYYAAGEQPSGVAGVDTKKLAAVLGSRGVLNLGDVAIRLVHPPWWRPLADSVGVIDAPGDVAADPIGPRDGTVPVGFSTLLIGYRPAGDDTVRYTILVPKRGQRSGIEGVQAILADRTRIERVNRRLPDVPDTGDDSADDGPDDRPGAPLTTGGPGTPGGSGRTGGSTPTDHDDKADGPDGPRLPNGSGPRLPG